MDLKAEASKAARIADALTVFRDPVAFDIDEINTTIAALNTLSNALRQTDVRIGASDWHTRAIINDDLRLVYNSVVLTFNDIWAILGKLGNGAANPSPYAYRQTWKEIFLHCRQGRQTLVVRLELYKHFLIGLCEHLARQVMKSAKVVPFLTMAVTGNLQANGASSISVMTFAIC